MILRGIKALADFNASNCKEFQNWLTDKDGSLSLNAEILIYGENGCGKTNILEAISLLSQGKGIRKSKIEDYFTQSVFNNNPQKSWGINADIVTPDGNINIGTGFKENSQKKSITKQF